MRRFFGKITRLLVQWGSTTVTASSVGAGTQIKAGAKVVGSVIANDVYVGPETRLFGANVGPYSSLGPRVVVGENEHEQKLFSTSDLLLDCIDRNGYEGKQKCQTEIGPDVWIGCNAFIRKGLRIGVGAIVGAHSVVLKDVPAYAIVVGVPARVIGFRFSEQTREKLEQSNWWLIERKNLQLAIVDKYGKAETPEMRSEEEILAFIGTLDTLRR
jgi:acetyltransferase-like isoleucine patch superfamily enzyme